MASVAADVLERAITSIRAGQQDDMTIVSFESSYKLCPFMLTSESSSELHQVIRVQRHQGEVVLEFPDYRPTLADVLDTRELQQLSSVINDKSNRCASKDWPSIRKKITALIVQSMEQ